MSDHSAINVFPDGDELVRDQRSNVITGRRGLASKSSSRLTAMFLALAFLASAASFGASAIPLTVDIIGEQPGVGIWLNESSPNLFGTMGGEPVPIKVMNIGLSAVNITYSVDDGSSENLTTGLNIDGTAWDSYSKVLLSEWQDVQELSVDGEPDSGQTSLEGGITIWARATSADEPALTDWTSFQGSSQNLGVTYHKGPVNGAELSWTADLGSSGMGSGLDSALLAADGKIFAVNYAGEIFAIDAGTGEEVWSVTSIAPRNTFELSTPVYNDGVLYVALSHNSSHEGFSVHALDGSTGEVLWSNWDFDTGVNQPNTPIVYDEGRLYLGTWESSGAGVGTYYCLDADDGSMVWSKDSVANTGYYWAGAAVIGPYLVYGDFGGNVTSVDKLTGTTVQEISLADVFGTTAGAIRSSIAYSSETGRIYLTDKGGYCYALGFDKTTGQFDTSDKWATLIGLSTCTPAVYGGKVYVGTGASLDGGGSGFYCLRESDGVVLWNYVDEDAGSDVFGIIQASAVISTRYDNGNGEVYIYFTTNVEHGSVYCLDSNGNLMWSYTPTEEQCEFVLQGVVVYDGRVYYGNDLGILFALGGD